MCIEWPKASHSESLSTDLLLHLLYRVHGVCPQVEPRHSVRCTPNSDVKHAYNIVIDGGGKGGEHLLDVHLK